MTVTSQISSLKSLALNVGVLLFLSSCITQTTAVLQGGQAAAPAKPNIALIIAKPTVLQKTVSAGHELFLGVSYDLNPDCTVLGLATARVAQQPAHGTVRIVNEDGFPSFPPANPRSACNTKKVAGTASYYKPDAGFTGSDYMEIEAISPAGLDTTFKISVTVK